VTDSRYPLLENLFRANARLHNELRNDDRYGFLRHRAEAVLQDAAALGIEGIQKLAEDGGSPAKFENLLAELRFAVMFAKQGANVALLCDAEFGGMRNYTPDLRVHFKNGVVALVEVFRFSPGDSEFAEALHEAAGTDSRYRLSYMVGKGLSTPALEWESRAANETLLERVIAQLAAALLEARGSHLATGLIHVFVGSEHVRYTIAGAGVPSFTLPEELEQREDRAATVLFELTDDGVGYVSGGVTSVHLVDDDAHSARLKRELSWKAKKWERLPSQHRANTPFIVAVQNDETWCLPHSVLSTLTGSRSSPSFGSDQPNRAWVERRKAQYPTAVAAAACAGWQPVLEEWDYGANARVAFTEGNFGVYQETPWARNLSGVVVAHQTNGPLQWLPNPWARSELNDPRLQKIGLGLAKEGSSR
jgi:hypothetical protein